MAGRKGHRLRNFLVASQMALALILSIGAGLMMKNFLNIRGLDPGFNPTGLLVVEIQLPDFKYSTRQQVADFHQQYTYRILRANIAELSARPWSALLAAFRSYNAFDLLRSSMNSGTLRPSYCTVAGARRSAGDCTYRCSTRMFLRPGGWTGNGGLWLMSREFISNQPP